MPCCWRRELFGIKNKHTTIRQEVLAGIMGWQVVASSIAFYASQFVGDEEGVDKDATAEVYYFVAGLSTTAFAVAFNVPFIVAPSVLYTTRETGVSMGGHLAAQATANLVVVIFFAFTPNLSVVSRMPTSLRVGAGCGISILVSVLGLRSIGLLTANSFALQPFTWQSVIGLVTVAAACCTVSDNAKTKKWSLVVGAPTIFTILVYAMIDRSKFEGFSAEQTPLSNWGGGSFGGVTFFEFWATPYRQALYMSRMFVSITLNICSILLVLIDAVCLENMHTKVKTSDETDFSNAIGGTRKFRLMTCSIPFTSFLGNLAGVTTQAAFVQSMIILFAGGKTGLSSAVTGSLLILTAVVRPLLPVLAPPHVSGALAIVITLRFFVVMRKVDVTRPCNLLMFGMSILLIPFSFDFVDSLSMAAVLGFLCEAGNGFIARRQRRRNSGRHTSTVAISIGEQNEAQLDTREGEQSSNEGAVAQTGRKESGTLKQVSFDPRRRISDMKSGNDLERGQVSTNRKEYLKAVVNQALPPDAKRRLHGLLPSRKSSTGAGLCQTSFGGAAMTAPAAGPVVVHWGFALIAMAELVLSTINNQIQPQT